MRCENGLARQRDQRWLKASRCGTKPRDWDLYEINEAFSGVTMAAVKEHGLDPETVNVHGGAVSLGHPIGCSGAFLATKAIYELQRINGRYALVTMCIGGGQGIAAVFERVS